MVVALNNDFAIKFSEDELALASNRGKIMKYGRLNEITEETKEACGPPNLEFNADFSEK